MSSLISPTPSENSPSKASHPLTITCAVIANVLIILIICFVFFFWKCNRGSAWDEALDNSSSDNSSPCSSPRASGVEAKDLSFLPEFVHGGTEGEEKEECAVCITEFVNGQIGRILPVCGHKFHIECVDTWFRKHSTCPVCRTDVQKKNVEEEREKMCLDV